MMQMSHNELRRISENHVENNERAVSQQKNQAQASMERLNPVENPENSGPRPGLKDEMTMMSNHKMADVHIFAIDEPSSPIREQEIHPQVEVMHPKVEEKAQPVPPAEVKKQCLFCAESFLVLQQAFACSHMYCQKCLKEYFENGIKLHRILQCPQQLCNAQVNQSEETFKSLSDKLKETYATIKFRKTIEMNNQLLLCPSEKCTKGYIEKKDGERNGKCKVCHVVYCLQCKMKNHNGECESFQEILLKDKFKYKQCMGCKKVVERVSGCPHMTCKCGTQFCYYCGNLWVVPHRCLRYLAGGDLMSDKIQNALKCMRPQDYEYDYSFVGYLVKIPSFLVCFLLMVLYITWCLIILFAIIAVALVVTLVSGYFAVQFKLCKDGTGIGCCLFCLMLIFLPLGIVIGWIFMFVTGMMNIFPKYLEFAFSGRLVCC